MLFKSLGVQLFKNISKVTFGSGVKIPVLELANTLNIVKSKVKSEEAKMPEQAISAYLKDVKNNSFEVAVIPHTF